MGGQYLDGDIAIELDVAREVHNAHSTPAELALKRILSGQRSLQVEELGRRLVHDTKSIAASRTLTTDPLGDVTASRP